MRLFARTGDFCLQTVRLRIICIVLAGFSVLGLSGEGAGCEESGKRKITVRDTIEMTEFADRGYFLGGVPSSPVAIFSPDGKQFLLRLKKGNVDRNVVRYWLLLFQTNEAFQSPAGRVVVAMESSSNREAITQVRWLDNKSIAFLGENPGEIPQVFRIELATRRLIQLTHHSTPVVAYDMSSNGRQLVFEAAPAPKRILESDEVRRYGLAITSQEPDDLLNDGKGREGPWADREFYMQSTGRMAIRVPSPDFLTEYAPLVLSPDGHHAVISVYLSDVPASWREYEDQLLHQYIIGQRKRGVFSNVQQYMLLDVEKRQVTPLFDAPKAWLDEGIAWTKDSKSVILSGAYLPLDSDDPEEKRERRMHPFVVEVEIASRTIHSISGERLQISAWDVETQRLSLVPGYGAPQGVAREFEKVGISWRLLPPSTRGGERQPIEVTLEEDQNTPPKIFVKQPGGGSKTLLLDLNPQLREFKLARVESMEWKATDGHSVRGGLYIPPDYRPGKRYPLVIQTHGYEEGRFWINGPWNSAFAAQPLAANGIMVLQVGNSPEDGEDRKYTNTPGEGPHRMAAYEGAIDELDRRGLIDRDRVGLIGFSRTAFHVAFAITHSKYRFRAATMADGFEGGYLNYLLVRGVDEVGVNGGKPVGAGLDLWRENSPGFNLDKVSTPLRLEYYGPNNFLGGWQIFSILQVLEKPVDFIFLPRGTHLLVRPWERLASQQGNVDWFRFWLVPEELCTAEPSETCGRWRELRSLQAASLAAP